MKKNLEFETIDDFIIDSSCDRYRIITVADGRCYCNDFTSIDSALQHMNFSLYDSVCFYLYRHLYGKKYSLLKKFEK